MVFCPDHKLQPCSSGNLFCPDRKGRGVLAFVELWGGVQANAGVISSGSFMDPLSGREGPAILYKKTTAITLKNKRTNPSGVLLPKKNVNGKST